MHEMFVKVCFDCQQLVLENKKCEGCPPKPKGAKAANKMHLSLRDPESIGLSVSAYFSALNKKFVGDPEKLKGAIYSALHAAANGATIARGIPVVINTFDYGKGTIPLRPDFSDRQQAS